MLFRIMKRRKVDKKEFIESNADLFFGICESIQKKHFNIEDKSLVKSKKKKKKKKNIDTYHINTNSITNYYFDYITIYHWGD